MEDLQFEAEFLTWDQASQNTFAFACHLTSTFGIRMSWDPFHPDLIASAANKDLAQAMKTTQHLVKIQHKDERRRAPNHGGVGRWKTSYHAVRGRGNVCDENQWPRCNNRIPNPSRTHPTNLPLPGAVIATHRTESSIRQGSPGEG